ncbi:MAG: hypothetical protein ACE5F6_20295, partial [Anaerolineae bacterium]
KPASGAALFGPAERCGPDGKSRSERDAGRAGGLRERPTEGPPFNRRCKPASGAALFGPAERRGSAI